jgi:hypothetical protein
MANAMGCGRHARNTSTDNGNFGSAKVFRRRGRIWGQELVQKPLYDLVEKEKWMEIYLIHCNYRLRSSSEPMLSSFDFRDKIYDLR